VLANGIGDEPFVRWFHEDRRVQATQEERLHTKPLPSVRPDLARLEHGASLESRCLISRFLAISSWWKRHLCRVIAVAPAL
jgi:hypothetical protein